MSTPETATWLLEFLLLQPDLDDAIANSLLRSIPITSAHASVPPLRVLRAVLLRRLAGDLRCSSSFPSRRIMHSIDLLLSLSPSSLLLSALSSVALHCAASAPDFFRAAEFLARRRLADAFRRFPSQVLKSTINELEAAITNPNAKAMIAQRDTKKEAIDAVKAFLDAEFYAGGKSFLEIAADKLIGDGSKEVFDLAGEEEKAMLNKIVYRMDGSTTTDGTRPSPAKLDQLPSPLVNEVSNALKSSVAELHQVVDDPLANAIRTASEVLAQMAEKRPAGGDDEAAERDVCQTVGVETISKTNNSNPCTSGENGAGGAPDQPKNDGTAGPHGEGPSTRFRHSGNARRRGASFMDWNPTARTFEWEDSIESTSDESAGHQNRPHLRTPRKRVASPLNIENPKRTIYGGGRRPKKKWSTAEEDALREGVKKHGRGSWKAILESYHHIFEGRTMVDLKDKWRNMSRQ